jgi:hypothetical protein
LDILLKSAQNKDAFKKISINLVKISIVCYNKSRFEISFCGSSSAVERRLPKPKVAGSNPVSRSKDERRTV